jgi:hypothetical protein
MIIDNIKSFLDKDILQLKTEIESYQREERIWVIDKGIANSAGNLVLHLIGNLNGFVGAPISNTGYVRNRVAEFADKDIPRSELVLRIEQTREIVKQAMDTLSDDLLGKEYPLGLGDKKVTYSFMLTMISTHLSYHLGQVNYHRRLLDY